MQQREIRYFAPRQSRWLMGGMLILSALANTSCRTNQADTPTKTNRIDRLVAAYPELRAGRFALLADFEDASHFELFHVDNASGSSPVSRANAARQSGTDGQALRWSTDSASDGLFINNDRAANWYLKRDWSAYDLLMFSVNAPRDLRLQIEISAGSLPNVVSAQSHWTLSSGPNVVRLDLSELGAHVALDDVRELRLSVLEVTERLMLILDDFILTGDREAVLGNCDADDGSLFVLRQAQRWRIGAGGRFEIVFAHGQIMGWYDLARDPQRLNNLLRKTILGPEWVESGKAVSPNLNERMHNASTRTEIVEANPVRVVVNTERLVGNNGSQPSHISSVTTWRYTIYPTGQVFVSVRRAPSNATENESIGLSVSAGQPASAVLLSGFTGIGADANRTKANDLAPGAMLRVGENETPLLFVPYFGSDGITWQVDKQHDGIVSLVATSKKSTSIAIPSACAAVYVRLGGPTGFDESDALREAMWFRNPLTLRPDVGNMIKRDDYCDFNSSGFDRTHGAYVFSSDDNLVRISLPEHGSPNPTPALAIQSVDGQSAWVYRDQSLHEPTARSAEGHLLFQLQDRGPAPRTIEIQIAGP